MCFNFAHQHLCSLTHRLHHLWASESCEVVHLKHQLLYVTQTPSKECLLITTFTIPRIKASGPQYILSNALLCKVGEKKAAVDGCPGALNPRLKSCVWAFQGNPRELTILNSREIQKNQQEITLEILFHSFKFILVNKLNTNNKKPVLLNRDSVLSQANFPSIVCTLT